MNKNYTEIVDRLKNKIEKSKYDLDISPDPLESRTLLVRIETLKESVRMIQQLK